MALEQLLEAAGAEKAAGIWRLRRANWWPSPTKPPATRWRTRTATSRELLIAVTQMLSGLKPDSLLASLPPAKQADLRGHSPGVMAAHLMEDAIAGWAAERLGVSGGGTGGEGSGEWRTGEGQGNVEAEVLQALLRGLKATRVAERLLQKIGAIRRASEPAGGSL